MSGFKMTTAGDLDLSTGGLVLTRNRADLVAQKLRNKLLFFLGEWFLDTRLGVPYFQSILVKNPDVATVRQILVTAISSTPGVVQVFDVNLEIDRRVRELTFSFKAKVDNGAIVAGGTGDPFIVAVISPATET
jgi:hypothetical protein